MKTLPKLPQTRTSISVVLLLSLAAASSAQSLDQIIQAGMKAQKLPGLTYAVLKDGKVIAQKAYGKANLEFDVSARPDNIFEVGSVTKQFTGALILMLQEEGKLQIEDPISKYLDGLPEAWKGITIRQAMNHTAGFGDYLGAGWNPRKDYSQKEWLEFAAKMKMDFKPGESWMYSNTGWYLAGLVVEKLTGKGWDVNVKERIFKPIGMKSSTVFKYGEFVAKRASGYQVGEKSVMIPEPLRYRGGYAAGAIMGTTADLVKWSHALMTGKLLKPETLKIMLEPGQLQGGRTYPYSIGWFNRVINGHPVYVHGGNTYGYSASNLMFPEKGLAVAILTNGAGASLDGLAIRIASDYAPELKAKPEIPTTDPNPERTTRLIRAINKYLNGQPDPNLHATELIARMQTGRGRLSTSALKSAFGWVWMARYLGETAKGTDAEVRVQLKTSKATPSIALTVTQDGKLARFGG